MFIYWNCHKRQFPINMNNILLKLPNATILSSWPSQTFKPWILNTTFKQLPHKIPSFLYYLKRFRHHITRIPNKRLVFAAVWTVMSYKGLFLPNLHATTFHCVLSCVEKQQRTSFQILMMWHLHKVGHNHVLEGSVVKYPSLVFMVGAVLVKIVNVQISWHGIS